MIGFEIAKHRMTSR